MDTERKNHMKQMKTKWALILVLTTHLSFAISNSDATKFVDQYESMSQKFIGFFNCVAKVMTGDEILTVANMKPIEHPPTDIQGCFALAGLKTGPGLSKFLSLFSGGKKEGDREEVQQNVESTPDNSLKAAQEQARKELEQSMNKNIQPNPPAQVEAAQIEPPKERTPSSVQNDGPVKPKW